ncbi:hypothetical protein E3U55_09075 [Filobacillus milosensis]|uniref:Uncharacterized protein n=1 Tax=Filobacillus milosensis TaxID=94137 RepID=A0A4Y8IS56_9BACI|nr:hypothetical protein [Filobacillus milosensis]TFB21453.1 hypothetical protein E3U55_09075 [Filobacillus milosensis]
MAGCCSIDPYTHFTTIIIGDGPLEIATALHLSSYGELTALVQSEFSQKRTEQFFSEFKPFIEENSEMPWNLEELEDDMHLILLNGHITIGKNNTIIIEDKEIYGKKIFSEYDTLKKIGFLNKTIQPYSKKEMYKKVSDNLWLLHPVDGQLHETIWRDAEDFAKYFVRGERENRRFK